MNAKQRKALLIETIAQGMDVRIYTVVPFTRQIIRHDYEQHHVTRVTPHNIYLDNVRHNWTRISHLVGHGNIEFFHADLPVAL
jgi:hypothetical protein